MKIEPVIDARSASLFLMAGVETPGVFCDTEKIRLQFQFGRRMDSILLGWLGVKGLVELTVSTMNPLIFPFSPSTTSLAQMIATSATGALEIQVLDPFNVYPSAVLVAVVSIDEGSEPWLGSVRP